MHVVEQLLKGTQQFFCPCNRALIRRHQNIITPLNARDDFFFLLQLLSVERLIGSRAMQQQREQELGGQRGEKGKSETASCDIRGWRSF